MITGHWLRYRPSILCRSALNATGRPNIPVESVFDSSRGQYLARQCISSDVCTNHTPYHIHDSKEDGSRFSNHQSRISMRDGPRNQVCILIWNAMHIITQRGGPPSVILNSRGEACMPMQCVLGMEDSMQHGNAMCNVG